MRNKRIVWQEEQQIRTSICSDVLSSHKLITLSQENSCLSYYKKMLFETNNRLSTPVKREIFERVPNWCEILFIKHGVSRRKRQTSVSDVRPALILVRRHPKRSKHISSN